MIKTIQKRHSSRIFLLSAVFLAFFLLQNTLLFGQTILNIEEITLENKNNDEITSEFATNDFGFDF